MACAAIRSQGPSRAQPRGGRGDYGAQDPADAEAVYPSQGEGFGGEAGVVPKRDLTYSAALLSPY